MKTAIIGLQYGDEGKGRVSEYYGRDADWFVRFNGGPNAGHTVYHEGVKHALHHLPAGAVTGKKVALDAGMVVDLRKLRIELEKIGMPHIFINEAVHIIEEKHIGADSATDKIGTTRSGIGPVYADRALRTGKRAGDLKGFGYATLYNGLPPIGSNENAIYEGAQGIMLDIDYGAYPYVSSGNIMPGMHHKIDKVVGVMKAYTTRVGKGPPYQDDIPELRERGGEFGTTTGRPRQCYWNDMNQLRYAISIVQPDEVVLIKADILEGMEIKLVESDKTITFTGNIALDDYIDYLIKEIPQIKFISTSPEDEMEEVG